MLVCTIVRCLKSVGNICVVCMFASGYLRAVVNRGTGCIVHGWVYVSECITALK